MKIKLKKYIFKKTFDLNSSYGFLKDRQLMNANNKITSSNVFVDSE